jgi:hypothetical protein
MARVEEALEVVTDVAALRAPLCVPTRHGIVHIATRADIDARAEWDRAFETAFTHLRKDSRYYTIVEDTILQGFEYGYFVLEDERGRVRTVQPFFLLDQDLLAGAGRRVTAVARLIRKLFPKFLKMRTLMVGCAAGEGHVGADDDATGTWIAESLWDALRPYARQVKARMIVFKEFPGRYRKRLACLSLDGYARIPSFPMTRVSIDYASFDDYMTKALSKATRKDLRRKFKAAAALVTPIDLEVTTDFTPHVDEAHALYLNVYNRSNLRFEKLTKDYLCRLGREMPDKVRFFLWRQGGRMIAFSLCMLEGHSIYDEYLGLDYSVALDLHLYHYTLRDIVEWAIRHGCKWYCSSALNYDPKLHLRCELVPLDLYVRHTSPAANFVLRRVLPWVAPTNGDNVLPRFANYAELWGER